MCHILSPTSVTNIDAALKVAQNWLNWLHPAFRNLRFGTVLDEFGTGTDSWSDLGGLRTGMVKRERSGWLSGWNLGQPVSNAGQFFIYCISVGWFWAQKLYFVSTVINLYILNRKRHFGRMRCGDLFVAVSGLSRIELVIMAPLSLIRNAKSPFLRQI